MLLTRRRLFSLLPAPLIVQAFNIMPVKVFTPSGQFPSGLLRVQWYSDGMPIPGANGLSLAVTKAMATTNISVCFDDPTLGIIMGLAGKIDLREDQVVQAALRVIDASGRSVLLEDADERLLGTAGIDYVSVP